MNNSIMTAEDIQQRFRMIATEEQIIAGEAQSRLAALETLKINLEAELKRTKDAITYWKTGQAITLREALKLEFDAHLQAGGDPKVHPRITLRRNSKWMFDPKAALTWAQENGIRDVIRVTESLDKRAMDKLVADGHYPDAEEVKSVTIVLPAMLGDLLISDKE